MFRQFARTFATTAQVATSNQTQNVFRGLALATLVGAGAIAIPSSEKAHASSDALHPTAYPWEHNGVLSSFDHAAIRRGFQVYKNVCATCHSVQLLAWRNLVDVAYTTEEVKAMAADTEVTDGPNDAGEMFQRPGRLSDKMPKPYENENQGRVANNGALPPDLSLIVKAREGHCDYIFALLTGYREPPPGVSVREGMYYNPYFAGGLIGMPPPLMDEQVDYDDGTPASVSQMAKDVTVFLNWAAEPEHDDRKKMGMKVLFVLGLSTISVLWLKRFKWNVVKHRTIEFKPMKK
eukprot:TRINITY_DN5234_c0_g1_i1.p1 TRINITY_DN5234_c0_g1~~TRINITY_DN5234_c0_g1_i1.p1  ORF type:complete len:292 (+),score=56.51 TRINITY_DN5234_c0_g1_i1:73-948(+)